MSDCASLQFSTSDAFAMRILTLVSASLSLLGSSFIVFSFVFFPRLRTFSFKLIAFLSICDFFSSLSYVIGMVGHVQSGTPCHSNPSFACFFSAHLSQFFNVATFLWVAVIGFNIYQVMVKNKGNSSRTVEQYEIKYHMFVWSVSLTLMLIPSLNSAFEDTGLWCWISPRFPMLQFMCYYLILLLVFIANSVVLLLVWISLRNDGAGTSNVITERLLSFLIVFFLVRCWSVFYRLNEYATEDRNVGLAFMHAIFSPLQGFGNALVFGTNRMVLNAWRNGYRRITGKETVDESADRELLTDTNGNHNDWTAISMEQLGAGDDQQNSPRNIDARMGDMQDVRW